MSEKIRTVIFKKWKKLLVFNIKLIHQLKGILPLSSLLLSTKKMDRNFLPFLNYNQYIINNNIIYNKNFKNYKIKTLKNC